MGKNLLWEIGTEELPARFIKPALESLKISTELKLKNLYLDYKDIKTAGTLRRLTLVVEDLAEKQKDREEEILGPSLNVGLNKDGTLSQAAIGFARKHGVDLGELKIKETPKGKYLYIKRLIPGNPTEEILPPLLTTILKEIYFPKTMRWGTYEVRFGRPIRWMMCLYGEKIIPIEVANVRASSETRGHRFLTKKPFKLSRADYTEYENLLEKNYVIVDVNKRKLLTKEAVLKACENIGVPEIYEELLEENANLVEYPFPIVGKFSEEFLSLPEPLIITALKEHQRYFCIRDENGRLLNYFVAINNNLPKNWEVVRRGHERVTKARLEDAKFYFEKDLQKPSEYFFEQLKGIVYHIKCGTLWDKTERLVELGKFLANKLGNAQNLSSVERACLYSKVDLASEVVGEFPSLQGIMGSILTERLGYHDISRAILEQYLPSPQEETLPESFEGTVLSLADKVDHLVSLFGIGEKPSGESDPYGLRRAAYGIIKILTGKQLFLDLEEVIKFAVENLKKQGFLKNSAVFSEVDLFLRKRLEGELLNLGFKKSVINVVTSLNLNPYDIFLRARALKNFQERADFAELITGFKRVAQMLKSADEEIPEIVDITLFELDEERNLYHKTLEIKPILADLIKSRQYTEYLEVLVSLKEYVDRFFEKVFVMVEDRRVRINRLSLLKMVSEVFYQYGDFTVFI